VSDPRLQLEDHVAVVTGGGGGIGGAISRRFASEGATVVVNDIDSGLLDATVADAELHGVRAVPVLGDIRDRTVVEAIRTSALRVANGRVDILVNNVGDFRAHGLFVTTTEEDWQAQYAITLEHVIRLTHAIAPTMLARRAGSIVNISTVEALRGVPRQAVYSAFNAAINAFTRSLAVEFGKDGVRVNAIAPDLADTLQTPADWMLGGRPPEAVRRWSPLGRFGAPDEFADVVLFLASAQSSYVTGQVLCVDGGTNAASGWYLNAAGTRWSNVPD
jgi:NAD(P)-dependent dehydrogenase (short-subunit alcohol dehydrogenase family)